jgi:hypothetical protein
MHFLCPELNNLIIFMKTSRNLRGPLDLDLL